MNSTTQTQRRGRGYFGGYRKWGLNQRIKYIGKPLVFISCLLPALWVMLKAFGYAGSLGTNPVEALLDHFGQWGLRFVLITLAVTPMRHIIGKPWPLRFRRMLGLFAFFYVSLHFLTYLWLDQFFVWSAILEDISKRPFITVGLVSIVLLTVLAVTSPHRARRVLGKRWNSLHRLVYPAAILAVWHFWWQVKKDVTEPLIYALILAFLLLWRLWKRVSRA